MSFDALSDPHGVYQNGDNIVGGSVYLVGKLVRIKGGWDNALSVQNLINQVYLSLEITPKALQNKKKNKVSVSDEVYKVYLFKLFSTKMPGMTL